MSYHYIIFGLAALLLAAPAATAKPGDDPAAQACKGAKTEGPAWMTTSGCIETPFEHEVPDGEKFRTYYEISRPKEQSMGSIVVFHGGPAYPRKHMHSNGYIWAALRAHFTVLYFHQRGSGYSGRITEATQLEKTRHLYSLGHIVDDAEFLRRKLLGNQNIILIGKSAGGFIALLYAIKHPDVTAAVVLAATSAHHGYISERNRVKREFFAGLDKRYPGFAAHRRRANEITDLNLLKELTNLKEILVRGNVLESVFFDLSYTLKGQFETVAIARDLADRRYDLLAKRLAEGRKTLRGTGLESIPVLNNISCRELEFEKTNPAGCVSKDKGREFDVRKRLGELKMPVLVLSGQYDPILPPVFQEEIVDGLKTEVTWHILDMSAHMIFQEQPNACAKYVLEFLGVYHQQPAQTPGL